MDRTIGRKTIIVDGFEDRCGRHAMNISSATVGFASYVRTAWLRRKQHSCKAYGDEIKSVVGAGDEYIACCADNTSSNTSMQNGLLGQLDGDLNLFILGCCVHGMDLLSEDVAKLPEIAEVIAEMAFTGARNATCENWPSFVRHQSVVTNLEVLHLQIISPSGMSHLPLCSARPHGHR